MRRGISVSWIRAVVVVGAVLALAACSPSETVGHAPSGSMSPQIAEVLQADPAKALKSVIANAGNNSTFAFSVAAAAGPQRITGTGTARVGTDAALQLDLLNADGSRFPVRLVQQVVYIGIPDAYRALVPKNWVSLSLLHPPAATGPSGLAEVARFLQDFDPVRQAKALLASGHAVATGEESVNGVRTVHYTAKVPVTVLIAQSPAALRSQLTERFATEKLTTVKLELWVDVGYRCRRTRWSGGTASGTADYSNWGLPVAVARPPAADTADLASVLPAFTGR
jgi:hypothetical protein